MNFYDPSGSADLSAVQTDEESKYVAEETVFGGFAGEVRAALRADVAGMGRVYPREVVRSLGCLGRAGRAGRAATREVRQLCAFSRQTVPPPRCARGCFRHKQPSTSVSKTHGKTDGRRGSGELAMVSPPHFAGRGSWARDSDAGSDLSRVAATLRCREATPSAAAADGTHPRGAFGDASMTRPHRSPRSPHEILQHALPELFHGTPLHNEV